MCTVYVTGTRYKKGTPGKPGSSGTLMVRIWVCSAGQWQTVELPYLHKKFVFTVDGLTVNLSNGAIEVRYTSLVYMTLYQVKPEVRNTNCIDCAPLVCATTCTAAILSSHGVVQVLDSSVRTPDGRLQGDH